MQKLYYCQKLSRSAPGGPACTADGRGQGSPLSVAPHSPPLTEAAAMAESPVLAALDHT